MGPAREGRALNLKVIAEIRCLEGNGQGGFDMARHGDARLNLGTARAVCVIHDAVVLRTAQITGSKTHETSPRRQTSMRLGPRGHTE